MARRKKTTPAEDFMSLIAMLPWWVGVALAIAFYVGLHAFAKTPLDTTVRSDQMGGFIVRSFARQLAQLAQYALPFFCLIGAAGSAWRRH